MLVDTHAHLFFKDFQDDLAGVLRRASDARVRQIVVPGTDIDTSMQAIALADEWAGIFACVGVHPHDAAKADGAYRTTLQAFTSHPKVVAIGEIGLDFHYDYSPRDVQRRVFVDLLDLAAASAKPVVIHTRESLDETIELCADVVSANPGWLPHLTLDDGSRLARRGVFHCFPGNAVQAARLRELGFCVSFPGIVTFKKSTAMQVVLEIGVENIMLETDAPFMAPVPLRGQRNEPAHVSVIAEAIAAASGKTFSEVAALTTRNAQRLFSLPSHIILE